MRTLYGYYMDMVGKDTLLQLVARASHLPFGGRVAYWHWWNGHPIAIWWAGHPIGTFVFRNIIRIA